MRRDEGGELQGLSQWVVTVKLCTWSPNKLWYLTVLHPHLLQGLSGNLGGGGRTRTYMSPNGGGGMEELRGLSHWVQLGTVHGAQINFGDLTPYLTYAPSLPLTRTFRQPWRRRWNWVRLLVLLLDPDLVVGLHQQLLLRLDVHVAATLLVSFTRAVY